MIKNVKAYFEKKKKDYSPNCYKNLSEKEKGSKILARSFTKNIFFHPCNHIHCHCTYLYLMLHHYDLQSSLIYYDFNFCSLFFIIMIIMHLIMISFLIFFLNLIFIILFIVIVFFFSLIRMIF